MNRLIDDPDVLVLDTRNGFEVEMGTFAGAVDPNLTSFSEFKTYVDRELVPDKSRKIAMFCTGGTAARGQRRDDRGRLLRSVPAARRDFALS